MMKWIKQPQIEDGRKFHYYYVVKFKLSKSFTLDNGTDFDGSHFQTAHAITVDGCIRLMQTKASHNSEDDGE